MSLDESNRIVAEFLRARGYGEDDIKKVIDKLAKYEDETLRKSGFDSIDGGGFDIDALIRDALED